MPLLEIEGLKAAYGHFQILHGVGLQVGPGEAVGLLGPNGAGKSTLLRCVSGLVRKTGGTMRWDGEPLDAVPACERARRGIVHVPEGRRLFPHMSVEENMQLGAFSPHCRRHVRANLDRVYELFPDLEGRRRLPAGVLSGGQQQMVAIGRGLCAQPRLLMLDEPSLGLAPRVVEEIFRAIRRIHQDGVAVLIVEQHVREALGLARRGYVLESGKMVVEGETTESLLVDERLRRAYMGI